jgi:dUTP pyrophosphatase
VTHTVYVAHPIDQRPADDSPHPLIMDVGNELSRCGFSSFWPRLPWHFDNGVSTSVVGRVNRAAQAELDGVVAILPEGMPTLGAPAEIERALWTGQPVAVISDMSPRKIVQLAEWGDRGAHVGHCPREVLLGLSSALDARESNGGGKDALRVRVDQLGVDVLPTRSYEGDAGYDLYVACNTTIKAGQWIDVAMGISIEMPPGVWCLIVGRSSTWRRKQVDVKLSIIDGGYRGPIFAACQNIGDLPITLRAGERVAQLVPLPLTAQRLDVQQVAKLAPSDRGEAGFGSSGT